MYDVGQLVGVIALITVVVNLLKFIPGFIKDGEAVANAVQTVMALALTLMGTFWPDALNMVPVIDAVAEQFAELGVLVLAAIPVIVKIGNMIHDVIVKIPFLNGLFGKQITP